MILFLNFFGLFLALRNDAVTIFFWPFLVSFSPPDLLALGADEGFESAPLRDGLHLHPRAAKGAFDLPHEHTRMLCGQAANNETGLAIK